MSIGAIDAANAYGRVLGAPRQVQQVPGPGGATSGDASFGDMVAGMVSDTSTSLRAAETASMRQVAGKGDLIDVVTAIGAAETALDTVVAVRDKVVSAYG